MKMDPNKHCIKFEQNLGWALIHDIFAHVLMGITNYSKYSIRFHDYTAHKAWKR